MFGDDLLARKKIVQGRAAIASGILWCSKIAIIA